jgi:hypothetical protein
MHSLRVLDKKGCSRARLREIFTAKGLPSPPVNCTDNESQEFYSKHGCKDSGEFNEKKTRCDKNATIRQRFEDKIRSRVFEGIANNAKNSRPCQAVDLAWDAAPIQRETIPLMMWATGKITNTTALFGALCSSAGCTPDAPTDSVKRFFKKVPEKDSMGELDVPRICDFQVDLMRSYVTRIHAGIDALWSNLYPLYKYNPRSSDAVAQLRGDALTQRVDIISESYNYRHLDSQCRRDMILYGQSIKFPRGAWDRKTSLRFKATNTGQESEETESYVVREGLDLVNPNPNRVFRDMSAPFANVNSDTGPSYLGYWGINRYGVLLDSSADYFNIDHICSSSGWLNLVSQFNLFFWYYFDPKVLAWPGMSEAAPALYNDREARIGYYSAACRDNGVLITEYFERINPKVEGIGDYDAEVWVRLTVAGDYTVIHAEFMPSIPAAYGAINWNDNRVDNQSIGMALLGYQDQASNIISHMLMQIRASLVQLWLIDKDSLEEPIRKAIEANAMNANWWVDPKVLVYSATKLRDLGITDPRSAFAIIQSQVSNVVESGYKSLAQLLNLADRLLILSPNELGQPNPREVAAREVQEISTSVQSISAFRQQGPREQVAATKQMIYESLVGCATDRFRVPVEGKYTKRTLQAAGFTIAPDSQVDADMKDEQVVPVKTPIMGNLRSLVYDYYFDDRDGAERVLNTQGATVVMQLLQSLLKIPGVPQKMGMKNIYDAANLVIRMSGAPWNFQFSLADGEDAALPPEGPPPEQRAQQQQMTQLVEQMAGRIQRLEGILAKLMGATAPTGATPPPGAPPPAPSPESPVGGPPPSPGAALLDEPPPA